MPANRNRAEYMPRLPRQAASDQAAASRIEIASGRVADTPAKMVAPFSIAFKSQNHCGIKALMRRKCASQA